MTSYKGDFSAVQLWQVHPCPFPLCCKLVRFDTWVTVAQLWSCTCAFACVHLCTLGHESGKPTAHRSMCQTIWCVATFSNNRKRNHGRFPFYYWSQDRPIHNMHCPEELLAAILFQKCLQTRFFLLSELKASSTKKGLFSDIELSLYMFGHWKKFSFFNWLQKHIWPGVDLRCGVYFAMDRQHSVKGGPHAGKKSHP